MRYVGIILTFVISFVIAATSFAAVPAMRAGHKYGDGRTIYETRTTKGVQGREYVREDGSARRRVLIYTQKGNFMGYSRLGREKGDAQHRHRAR